MKIPWLLSEIKTIWREKNPTFGKSKQPLRFDEKNSKIQLLNFDYFSREIILVTYWNQNKNCDLTEKTPFLQKWDILKKFNTLWISSCSPFCTCAAGLQWCYGTFVRCACRRYLPRRHGLWKLFWFDSPIAPRPAWRKTIANHLACKINHTWKKPDLTSRDL